jgi:hypothetical protein
MPSTYRADWDSPNESTDLEGEYKTDMDYDGPLTLKPTLPLAPRPLPLAPRPLPLASSPSPLPPCP